MIKILILVSYMIVPPISGGAMRTINPLVELSRQGYEVTYLYQGLPTEYFKYYPNIRTISVPWPNRVELSHTDNIDISIDVLNVMDWPYLKELEKLLRAEKFDIIQIEHSYMSWVVPLIRTMAPDTPVILDLHNVEHAIHDSWIPYLEGKEKAEMQAQADKMHEWELDTWSWFDACLAVSTNEKAKFELMTGWKIPAYQLPTGGGIDLTKYPWPPARNPEHGSICFLGTMGWTGNQHGLTWFIDNVLPLLEGVKLYVAGYGRPENSYLTYLSNQSNIRYLGEISEDRALNLYNKCEVFIVPLFIGAGARVKITTAWAAGIPVVSTSLGADGLKYHNNKDILIADTPDSFAGSIKQLMGDWDLGTNLSVNGRALSEECYSLEYSVHAYQAAYQDIIGRGVINRESMGILYERKKAITQVVQLKSFMKEQLFVKGSKCGILYSLITRGLRILQREGIPKFLLISLRWVVGIVLNLSGKAFSFKYVSFDRNYKKRYGDIVNEDPVIRVIENKSRCGAVIYDIGAYTGYYSVYLAKVVPKSKLYAFEPNTETYNILSKNASDFGLRNISIFNKAISDKRGKSTLFISSDIARTSLHEANAVARDNTVVKKQDIECTTIDILVGTMVIKPPNIIKIDTEGNEYQVLSGALGTIKKYHPAIFYERHKDDSDVRSLLSDLGYYFSPLGYSTYAEHPESKVVKIKVKDNRHYPIEAWLRTLRPGKYSWRYALAYLPIPRWLSWGLLKDRILIWYWMEEYKKVNFGDHITERLVQIFGYKTVRYSVAKALGILKRFPFCLHIIGSEFHKAMVDNDESNIIYIWGLGNGYGEAFEVPSKVKVYAVRGPYTARLSNLENIPFGDPGFLMPYFYKFKIDYSKNKVTYVPHISNRENYEVKCRAIRAERWLDVVVSRCEFMKCLRDIVSSKFVLTNSYHTAIICQAYDTPWALCLAPGDKLDKPEKWKELFEYLGVGDKDNIVYDYDEGLKWWRETGSNIKVPELLSLLKAFPLPIKNKQVQGIIEGINKQ